MAMFTDVILYLKGRVSDLLSVKIKANPFYVI